MKLLIILPVFFGVIAFLMVLRNSQKPAVCKKLKEVHELEIAEYGNILSHCTNKKCEVCNPTPLPPSIQRRKFNDWG